MCRWLAYSGSPVTIEMLLYKPKHSLIDQSLHSTMGAETTNGDGPQEFYTVAAMNATTGSRDGGGVRSSACTTSTPEGRGTWS